MVHEGHAYEDVRELLLAKEPWRERAACRNLDMPIRDRVKLFFPAKGGGTAAAKAVCARCPVTRECNEYAERTRTEYGVWAGVTRQRPKRTEDLDATEESVSDSD